VIPDPPQGLPDVPRDWGSTPIIIAKPPPADLEVVSVTAPATAIAGQPMAMSWRVANNGLAATAGNFWLDGVYLSPTATLNLTTARQLSRPPHSGVLETGSTYTFNGDIEIPGDVSATSTSSSTPMLPPTS